MFLSPAWHGDCWEYVDCIAIVLNAAKNGPTRSKMVRGAQKDHEGVKDAVTAVFADTLG
jgi:hypothetical protein